MRSRHVETGTFIQGVSGDIIHLLTATSYRGNENVSENSALFNVTLLNVTELSVRNSVRGKVPRNNDSPKKQRSCKS